MLNRVTSDSDILADTVKDFGPCLNDEGETDAQVRFRVRPCNLCPHLRVRPATYPASWTLCRSGVCVRSLMLRAYNRDGDGRLEEERNPELFSRCGRAGKENGTGYWDVAQNHTQCRTGVAASYQAGAFPLTGPDDSGELSSMFHPRRWRCLMKTLMNRKYYPKEVKWYICITKVCIQPLLFGRCPPG